MKKILVTGGKGQLASCIKDVSKSINNTNFIYVDIEELDITNAKQVSAYFKESMITHCINCAAYTSVDHAESNEELAKSVNVNGAKNLAEACERNNTVLIHISTDFVFDGKQTKPYSETDKENPLSVYGLTKFNGEKAINNIFDKNFIIRTSWLYSEYGHNFLKTMLKLGREKSSLSVVSDQIGTPTYAGDLANLLVGIVQTDNADYGTYHFSNEGVASWYDFAHAILDISDIEVKLLPIKTEAYHTPATRPAFSVMDKTKIKQVFGVGLPYWRDSLREVIAKTR